MPYTVTTTTLPCGAPCLRIEGSGVISKEDALYLLTLIGRKGSSFGVPMLVLAQQMKSLSPEARNLYGANLDGGADLGWCGLVVTSMLIRVTAQFVLRVSGYNKVRMFSTEAEAVGWLDERARADAAAAKPT